MLETGRTLNGNPRPPLPRGKPLLAITLGDVAGIGPEVVVRAWQKQVVHKSCCALAIGHPEILRRAVRLVCSGRAERPIEIECVNSPAEVASSAKRIPCLATGADDQLQVVPGQADHRSGQAAYESIVLAAQLAGAAQVDGIVTAPISKAALWQAGHRYPGHTELLAELFRAAPVAMMLYLPPGGPLAGPAGLGIVHVTLHTSIRSVAGQIDADSIVGCCRLADQVMSRLARRSPRIGVAALNPHAGEGGLFGDEEQREIAPAVARARDQGLDVTGPLPADSLMVRARQGEFDAVVAMYHDQGHIAVKLLAMHRAVNVTLGLPVIRTSAAHGTAPDIAWKGVAQADGMLAATKVAAQLARRATMDGYRTGGAG
jgi:4-hydroxythreonine-4-phosphate dehydrogenase